jgi:hypothetical protein
MLMQISKEAFHLHAHQLTLPEVTLQLITQNSQLVAMAHNNNYLASNT